MALPTRPSGARAPADPLNTILSGELFSQMKSFLAEYIRTVESLEVLLLLQADPGKAWNATDVSRELRFDPISAANRLMELYVLGLVTHGAGAGKLSGYHYGPPKRLRATVDGLAHAFRGAPEAVRDLLLESHRHRRG